MKNRNRNERNVVLCPAREDSGVATSGEIGELSFSGECEGVVCLQERRGPKEIEEDENQDPRSDLADTIYVVLLSIIWPSILFYGAYFFTEILLTSRFYFRKFTNKI